MKSEPYPLSEVNALLSEGHKAQAVYLLELAIQVEPFRQDLKRRLAEVKTAPQDGPRTQATSSRRYHAPGAPVLVTWVLMVFAGMLVFGPAVLFLYMNPNVLSDLNPWSALLLIGGLGAIYLYVFGYLGAALFFCALAVYLKRFVGGEKIRDIEKHIDRLVPVLGGGHPFYEQALYVKVKKRVFGV